MTLDKTIAEDSLTVSDRGTPAWKLVGRGPDGDSYVGMDPQHQVFAELRLLHGISDDEDRLAELRSKLRLIDLANHDGIQRVLTSDLATRPASLVLAISDSEDRKFGPLSDLIDGVPTQGRLQVAMQLIETFLAAHHVGLQHDHFGWSRVLVSLSNESPPKSLIDFSGLNCCRAEQCEANRVIDDLDSIPEVISKLLEFDGGSTMAMEGSADEPATLRQWQEKLRRMIRQGVSSAASPNVTCDDDSNFVPTEEIRLESEGLEQPADDQPEQLGRFKIVSQIGKGGMGVVYRAVDLADDQPVAVKVLRTTGNDIGRAIRRFRKEARLLGDAQNDHVTRLIEIGEQDGQHYLVMELVEGIDLKSWFKGRAGLGEKVALRLLADIARALVDAHSKEVIHRDIKPENVLLQWRGEENDDAGSQPLSAFRVKLTDFGIARHVNQTVSMELTQAGTLLGTPRYMAPEQFDGDDQVSPAADVYSLGVTLYELLTGNPPFEGNDVMDLALKHRTQTPPSVQLRNAAISDSAAKLVSRMLAKDPAKRFGDAAQLVAEIETLLHGEAVSIEAHPKSPLTVGRPVWDKSKNWNLDSDPEQLWPFVSNTERLNHAIGLPSVTYRTEKDADLGLRKFGSFRLAGLNIAWEEHPFEWIEGKRMGILREFTSGPFQWFLSTVTLDAMPGGGTRLTHRIRIQPRSFVGRILTTLEADWKAFKNLDRVYRRMDRSIQGKLQPSEGADAFQSPAKLRAPQQTRLDARVALMIDGGVEPAVASKLRDVIGNWPEQEISHLRPLQLADLLSVAGPVMVDACLVAASVGLLQLRWDVLCPTCRAPASTNDHLAEISKHTACEACDVEFQSNIGNAIEMVFRVHPEIRSGNDAQYCIGGPEHSPHVVAQVRIESAERMALKLDLGGGDFLIRGPRLPQTQSFRIRDQGAPSTYQAALSTLGYGVHVPLLRRGQQTITLTNDLPSLHVVRIERMIPRDDVVTAATASTMAKFRQLFPHQSFDVDNPVATEEVTLMATCINNIDRLYADAGDTSAYNTTHRLADVINGHVVAQGGTVTKTMGERVLAAFPRRDQAVRAAANIRDEIGTPSSEFRGLCVGIGIHAGPTLVTTENDRLDYFGSSVRAVNELSEVAGSQTLMTEVVFSDALVANIMGTSSDREIETRLLRGIAETRVCRL